MNDSYNNMKYLKRFFDFLISNIWILVIIYFIIFLIDEAKFDIQSLELAIIIWLFVSFLINRLIKISNLNDIIGEFNKKILQLEMEIKGYKNRISELEKCILEKDELYDGLSKLDNNSISKLTFLYSDFILVQYDISAKYLDRKSHPAHSEALRIRDIKGKTRIFIQQYKEMLYKYQFLLNIFPELSDYVDDFTSLKMLNDFKCIDNVKEEYDRVRDYFVSKEEYNKYSVSKRNQIALDRYIKGQKTKWQIGRDYELCCGQYFENKGYHVVYFGTEMRLNDMGRDLIATKDNIVYIIQCKYWSQTRLIHEKHIAQLYGSMVEYSLGVEQNLFIQKIEAVFLTNIELSETAKRFAERLGVIICKKEMNDFPRIKCNINNGEKIYHLPFDQQYDRTQIKNVGEFYATTIKEAEDNGFRRAFRHLNI
jgi:hypothetical protein